MKEADELNKKAIQEELEKGKANPSAVLSKGWELFGFNVMAKEAKYLLSKIVPSEITGFSSIHDAEKTAVAEMTQEQENVMNHQDFVTEEDLQKVNAKIASYNTETSNWKSKLGIEEVKISEIHPFYLTGWIFIIGSLLLDISASLPIIKEEFTGNLESLGMNTLLAMLSTIVAGYAGKYFSVVRRIKNTIREANRVLRENKDLRPGVDDWAAAATQTATHEILPAWLVPATVEDRKLKTALLSSHFGRVIKVGEQYSYRQNAFIKLILFLLLSIAFLAVFAKGYLIDFGVSTAPFMASMLSLSFLANFGYFLVEYFGYSGLPFDIQGKINKILKSLKQTRQNLDDLEEDKRDQEEEIDEVKSSLATIYHEYEATYANEKVAIENFNSNLEEQKKNWTTYSELKQAVGELQGDYFEVITSVLGKGGFNEVVVMAKVAKDFPEVTEPNATNQLEVPAKIEFTEIQQKAGVKKLFKN